MGAPLGNKNAAGHRIWSDAIRKQVLSRKQINKLAEVLVEKALSGDNVALKELGDRLEGKPAQTIQGPDEHGIPVNLKITYVDPTPKKA